MTTNSRDDEMQSGLNDEVGRVGVDSHHETAFWLSQPGILDELALSRQAAEDGDMLSVDEVRARYGAPKR